MCEKQRKEHVLIIDVIITAIMLVCLISGFRRGFARTLIGTLGWLVALVAAFFAADPVRNIIILCYSYLRVSALIEVRPWNETREITCVNALVRVTHLASSGLATSKIGRASCGERV